MKNPSSFAVSLSHLPMSAKTTALIYRADNTVLGATLVLGHGAGAGQTSPFMVDFARALSELGLDVVTFNFPYAEQRRRIPDRGAVLEACFQSVIEWVDRELASARRALFIGGKSMGGRIATQVAAADHGRGLAGLVLLGYPLHPPGRPDERRAKHLASIRRPMLFVQGSRDAFGTPGELAPILETLEPVPSLHVVEGGDHSLVLKRKDPAAQLNALAAARQAIVDWIASTRTAR